MGGGADTCMACSYCCDSAGVCGIRKIYRKLPSHSGDSEVLTGYATVYHCRDVDVLQLSSVSIIAIDTIMTPA